LRHTRTPQQEFNVNEIVGRGVSVAKSKTAEWEGKKTSRPPKNGVSWGNVYWSCSLGNNPFNRYRWGYSMGGGGSGGTVSTEKLLGGAARIVDNKLMSTSTAKGGHKETGRVVPNQREVAFTEVRQTSGIETWQQGKGPWKLHELRHPLERK